MAKRRVTPKTQAASRANLAKARKLRLAKKGGDLNLRAARGNPSDARTKKVRRKASAFWKAYGGLKPKGKRGRKR